jgi:pyruvate dehydrogenase E1 component alpha subunit
MYLAYQTAARYALSGKGPVLIEAFTYRLGAHTTSDDPTKYRSKKEETEWGLIDPLIRLRRYMENEGIWNIDVEKLTDEYKQQINQQFLEAEQNKAYSHDEVFAYMYTDMPDDLKRQKAEYEQFLSWKENRK